MGNSESSSSRESTTSLSQEDCDIQNGFVQLRSTHDISHADHHIPNAQKFVSDLQEAVKAIRSSPNEGRYNEVHVLFLYWKDDNIGVRAEAEELRNVFQKLYRFQIHQYEIQGEKPGRDTQLRVTSFLQNNDGVDNLLVLYYAGHSIPSRQGSEAPIWSATDRGGSQTVSAGGIQALFEEADSDALLLYDSCHSAHPAVTISGHGVTEVIAASGFEFQAPGPGRTSFTHALIRALTESCRGPPFSAAKLHEMVLRSLKSTTREYLKDERGEIWTDHNGRPVLQRYPTSTPVHCFLTEARPHRGIILTPLPLKLTDQIGKNHSGTSSGTSTAGANTITSSLISQSTPASSFLAEQSNTRVLLSVRLQNDFFRDDMVENLSVWREWMRNIPPEAEDLKIEALYDSFSTLILLTVPITLWDLLPENPAYSFVGFVTSDNQLSKLDQMDFWAAVEKQAILEPFLGFEVVDTVPNSPVSHNSSRAPSMSSASSWMGQAFPFSRTASQAEAVRELKAEPQDLKAEHRDLNKEYAVCKAKELNLEGQLSATRNRLKTHVTETKVLQSQLWECKSKNDKLEYQLKMESSGGYKDLCTQLSQMARGKEEVIRDLEEKVEDRGLEVKDLRRRMAYAKKLANPEEYGGTKEKRRLENEVLRKKILERDDCFELY